jgi:hypothetical protein
MQHYKIVLFKGKNWTLDNVQKVNNCTRRLLLGSLHQVHKLKALRRDQVHLPVWSICVHRNVNLRIL